MRVKGNINKGSSKNMKQIVTGDLKNGLEEYQVKDQVKRK